MSYAKYLLFLPALYYLWFFVAHNASGSGLLAVIVLVSAMIPLFLAEPDTNSENAEKRKVWFKVHRYGYGWSPNTWHGWIVMLVMLILFVFVGVLVDVHSNSVSDTLITAFPFWFLILTTFFTIVQRKGEKPKWRWGNKS